MSPLKKVLVLGASGLIGRPLLARLGAARGVGTYHCQPMPGALRFDALSMDLADIIKEPEVFSHAVILFAEKNPGACAADPRRSHELNVASVSRVLSRLRHWQVRPVFASTEFVFDGTRGWYDETDPINPILLYGRQKSDVEDMIRGSCDRHIILRFAKIYGLRRGDSTLFTNWLDAIERGQTIRCAVDQVFTPTLIDDAVEAVVRLIDRDRSGTYHISSGKAVNRAELFDFFISELRRIRPIAAEVTRVSLNSLGLNEKWPLNVSLNPGKLLADTGLEPSDVHAICRRFAREAPRTPEVQK